LEATGAKLSLRKLGLKQSKLEQCSRVSQKGKQPQKGPADLHAQIKKNF
jgi:hypothetical protein